MDIGDERIEIIHVSYYKSDSHFRDKWIYPFFHRIIIKDFHRNMRRLLNLNKQNENNEAANNIRAKVQPGQLNYAIVNSALSIFNVN
jgi:hypothetical protein